jgi:hypothetical protein
MAAAAVPSTAAAPTAPTAPTAPGGIPAITLLGGLLAVTGVALAGLRILARRIA